MVLPLGDLAHAPALLLCIVVKEMARFSKPVEVGCSIISICALGIDTMHDVHCPLAPLSSRTDRSPAQKEVKEQVSAQLPSCCESRRLIVSFRFFTGVCGRSNSTTFAGERRRGGVSAESPSAAQWHPLPEEQSLGSGRRA